jgi:hypothetical protein
MGLKRLCFAASSVLAFMMDYCQMG